ncbi:MAG TPA: ABC transporter ATP-binding protein, partial [Leucothrix sp.]|nr:ABC transporter ATP-binding protein [Leucothrix sp.]
RKGMSVLFITHDFGVVAQIAHRVGVMKQGKLVEIGKTKDVLSKPQHDYSKKLLAAVPDNLPRRDKSNLATEKPIALVTTKNLDVFFPIRKGLLQRVVDHVRAVDDVSIDINKGRIVALVGESGSGKTTLGRAILQLQKPTAGSVTIDGHELVGLSTKAMKPWRQKMQIAFQDPQSSLNPRLLVVKTLTEPMKVHGIGSSDDERIELAGDVLEAVQLERDFMWRYPHEFSGGQRQRIGLARALALNPEFIVCDEITSALDVSVQAEVLQLLLEIRKKRDLTLLFITHNISVVEYLCDETIVMKNGKVVEQGLTDDVCGNPQNIYTKKLLEAVPRLNF